MSLADSRWASPSTRPRSRYPSSTSTVHSSVTPHLPQPSTASRASNSNTSNNTTTASATATSTTTSAPTNTHRLHDLALCTRLIRRLKWKAELLLVSHRYVVSSCSNHSNQANQNTSQDDALGKEATTMFKLDFFEFFVLLERCIALLLACLRIAVPRTAALPTSTSTSAISSSVSGASSSTTSTSTSTTSAGDDGTTSEKPIFATRGRTPHPLSTYSFPSASTSTSTSTATSLPLITPTSNLTSSSANPYTHRYHAALLSTLDLPSNPIHSILGVGDVRRYLGMAKECRNKWKTAGEATHTHTTSDTQKEGGWEGGYTVESLELERMLPCVLEALDRARDVTEEVVRDSGKQGSEELGGVEADIYMGMDMDIDVGFGDDGAWEAVPDAMEWE